MKAKVCHIFLACLLLLVKESQPTPLASPGCSSIVPPPNTDGCDGSVSLSLAEFRDRRDNIIKPKLDSIEGNMTAVFNNLAYVNETELTYNVWRDGETHQLEADQPEGIIGASVNRFKCMAIAVADIVANESIRYLVDEEPHFATEFQSVLESLDVLLDIKEVVLRSSITGCILQSATCADYCVLERDVQIKSVAFELKNLPAEVKSAFDDSSFNAM